MIAELILFSGRCDPELLKRAHEQAVLSGASQPAEDEEKRKRLRKNAILARAELRKAEYLRTQLVQGLKDESQITWHQRQNQMSLDTGDLLARVNMAVAAYGHGTLRSDEGEMVIGGSTGGLTRSLLDDYKEPNTRAFLARRPTCSS